MVEDFLHKKYKIPVSNREERGDKMEKTNNKKKIVIGVVVLAVLVVAALGMYLFFGQKPTAGSKKITLDIVYVDGSQDDYELQTDAEYLLDAANEIEDLKIEGHNDGSYFYIDSINGVSADYDADGAYWAIYVDGAYGNYGIAEQPIEDGGSYEIRYEVWTE